MEILIARPISLSLPDLW